MSDTVVCKISGTQTVTGKISAEVDYVNNVLQYTSEQDFPKQGNPDLLYVAKDINSLFRYDKATERYYSLGGGYSSINCIDGGTANG